MNILITGGGGFLGTVLVRQLLERKPYCHLVILDRFDHGVQPIVSILSPGDARYVRLIRGDIRDADALARAVTGVDQIVHLAGIVGYPACDANPQDAESTNVGGTRQLVRLSGARPIIFASTGSTYGKVAGTATEETPISPLTRYGRTKAEAERFVLDDGGCCLRFATLYGLSPRMRWDLLPNNFCRLGVAGKIDLFDPQVRRTFMHVEDAADAIRWALDKALDPGIYNVGMPAGNLTKAAVAYSVQRLTGCAVVSAEGHDPDERDYAVSYEKIRATGWRAIETLNSDSLAQVVEVARVWE